MRPNAIQRRLLVALAVVVVVGLVGALAALSHEAEARSSDTYQRQRSQLDAELKAAATQGYTSDDLSPIASQWRTIESAPAPFWLLGGVDFYRNQAGRISQLRTDLRTLEQRLLTVAETDARRQIDVARSGIEQDRQLGADQPDLQALQKRLEDLARAQGAAHSVTDYRNVSHQARALSTDASALAAATQAETAEVRRATEELKSATGGNVDAIRKAGGDAVSQGRNDASVAAYMNRPGPFKGYDAITRAYGRLEHYAAQVGSGDLDQAATGAAAARRYAGQIHDALIAGLPHKAIIVSHEGQELWAYEDGKVVRNTLVTTGKPPDLATDLGPMKVLSKQSPWKMHSPWPKGSPYWYPDAMVQMVVWFTRTGEGLHDASWQNTPYGPNSQYGPSASHGCIHVPFESESFLFSWAEVGTPVIVYAGDGSPVGNQLGRISTDDQGNPLTGPKGA
jgi:lipoprotein-anchoring transpeptidase ErfK/SrfK